ncbi:MAG TPA: response regulator transcription factor [Symbiobacteriaceae bacterium]|jgi:two-component system OmpR family response regulator|nr:response regulator transcription factor [Symbiobacteriaceae bacterium]
MSGERILIADDDERLRQVVDEYLRAEGYTTLLAADGNEALRLWQEKRPDLLVLDWMMPGQSGLEVARQIRQHDQTPVVMLTARTEETDKLLGLELGADDYLTKPFSLRELLARIRAVLRRSKPEAAQPSEVINLGEITINLAAHAVHAAGQEVSLTATEFKLLAVLARSPNRVFSRLQLMEAAVGDYYEGYERTIDSHISHLRRKLGVAEGLIQTVKGTGYKLVQPKG